MKKRILALIFALVLFASACAEEDGLAAVFARGPKLIEVETDFSSFPDGMSGAYIVSMSPNGSGSIVVSDDAVYTVYEGSVSELHASFTRGVPDDNGHLGYAYTNMILKDHILSDKYGITWSHNGRYAVPQYTAIKEVDILEYWRDPLIIDTATGEMYLAATHPNGETNNCALVSAVFNADDSLLYYELGGRPFRFRYALMCYDMEKKTETCIHSSLREYWYPHPAILKNGELMLVWDTYKLNEPEGITCVRVDDLSIGERIKQAQTNDVTSAYVNAPGFEEHVFSLPVRCWQVFLMEYSEDSGFCVALGWSTTGISFSFQCFRPDDRFAGMNEYWAITSDFLSVVRLETEELTVPYGEDTPYCSIVWMVLSPDGGYALALCSDRGEGGQRFVLIDLNHMTCVPVEGSAPTAEDISAKVYCPIIEWNDDILMGVNGEVKRFRLGTD